MIVTIGSYAPAICVNQNENGSALESTSGANDDGNALKTMADITLLIFEWCVGNLSRLMMGITEIPKSEHVKAKMHYLVCEHYG